MATELRRYRIDAGLSTTKAGELLGISQSQVSRVETGSRGLKPDEIAAMLGLYQVPAARREEIMELVRQSAEPGWWVSRFGTQLPQQWQALIDYEKRATTISDYEMSGVPGLLQTTDYARAIIEGTAERPLPSAELDAKVSARLGRQSILSRSTPPTLSVLIHESALRLPVGGPGVMRRQLLHLCDMSDRPAVSIQVVLLAAGPHAGLDGSFRLMDIPDEPSVVYQESKTRNAFLEQEDVDIYRLAWQQIGSVALLPGQSREMLATMAEDYA
ncbi:helix-turn-helix domain-containing protein [Actinokineospora sp.]|uniref:helix-turn-helix domain-containing protein n=1 Tax=Actinokineospora sp. TaxID=1872133 RepID=UPI004037F888